VPVQTVDATPSNALIQHCFPRRTDPLAVASQNLARAVFSLV
jgi:hypothetical protein